MFSSTQVHVQFGIKKTKTGRNDSAENPKIKKTGAPFEK